MCGDRIGYGAQISGLVLPRPACQSVRIGQPVRHDFAPARAGEIDQIGGVVVDLGIQQQRDRKAFPREPVYQTKAADPVAIVAPRGVGVVGLGRAGKQVFGQPVAKDILLYPQRQIHGKPLAAGPRVIRAAGDRAVGVTGLARQHRRSLRVIVRCPAATGG